MLALPYGRGSVALLVCGVALLAQKYSGPRPPQRDLLYLVHASNLVPTEAVQAHEETKKDNITYWIGGPSSPARTPLAEPIFLLATDKLSAESLELYKFDIKNGRREVTLAQKSRRGSGPRELRVSVTRLDSGLFRLEAAESLENGEYGMSPSGSNVVFCFQVY